MHALADDKETCVILKLHGGERLELAKEKQRVILVTYALVAWISSSMQTTCREMG
mgnify:CR=1 FL=1